jgi:hypothetical protein
MNRKIINNSSITYHTSPPKHIKEYYNYCLNILISLLEVNNNKINIIFGDLPNTNNFNDKTIRLDIQCEHTIVKRGGRGVTNEIFGNTSTNDNDKYLIRIDKYDYLKNLDYIIDYSYPNLNNIKSSPLFEEFSKKIIVVEPTIDDLSFSEKGRNLSLSMFTVNHGDRREHILNKLYEVDNNFTNVTNCFSQNCLKELYGNTKILVNVHQTDHHHTLEELRILPALSNGVIVISEDVPLKEHIPYSDYIVWSKYEDLPNKLLEVQENYTEFFCKIFNEELKNIMVKLSQNNVNNLSKIFK